MITIENVDVYGFEAAIRGMRNPMESWDKSDSGWLSDETSLVHYVFGEQDRTLANKLINAGTDHRKFMRFIMMWCDITAPLYWLKEMDTYRAGVEKNSCSTMHRIHAREFTRDDFSREQNLYWGNLDHTIDALNHAREQFLATKDKRYWYSMIQTLPSSYNQRRTYVFSYEALRNIYHARHHHKLDEWRHFCDFIKTLPYSELITGEGK